MPPRPLGPRKAPQFTGPATVLPSPLVTSCGSRSKAPRSRLRATKWTFCSSGFFRESPFEIVREAPSRGDRFRGHLLQDAPGTPPCLRSCRGEGAGEPVFPAEPEFPPPVVPLFRLTSFPAAARRSNNRTTMPPPPPDAHSQTLTPALPLPLPLLLRLPPHGKVPPNGR